MGNQITEVRLLAVPLENDYKHTLHFSGKGTQAQYFVGKSDPNYTYTNLSYQRKDKYISIPGNYEDLRKFNYLMYRNRLTSQDWKYAFITKMEYRSDEVTWVYFETDVLQTYLKDYTVKPSFVEREHTNDDTVGKHTFPENLECGEFVCQYTTKIGSLDTLYVVLAVTEKDPLLSGDGGNSFWDAFPWNDSSAPPLGLMEYSGAVSGLMYYAFPISQIAVASQLVSRYSSAGKADAIQSIFLAPAFLVNPMRGQSANNFEFTIPRGVGGSIGGYAPRNKKLLTFPYNYMLVSNNAGASAVMQYEHFALSGVLPELLRFKIYGSLTPGCSIRMVPMAYKGVEENNEEGLNLGKYPVCNWTSDAFTNWLTQNSVNIGLTLASGVGQIVGGFATGGASAISGVGTIAGQLAQIHQMSFTPHQSKGNINSGDVTTAMGKNTFSFYAMAVKEEYARIIDGFFDMFGYKVNQVKVPLSDHRPEYWYTKTIDVSIDGDVPAEDMQIIKDCYNRGVTFWKNPSNIGDYSVSNTI